MKQFTIIIRATMAEDVTKAEVAQLAMAAAVQVEDPEELASPVLTETEIFMGVGPYSVQRFRATNDTNGNPRRVFVFRDGLGDIVQTTDEEYLGRASVTAFEAVIGTRLVDLGDVACSVTEYKELLKIKG